MAQINVKNLGLKLTKYEIVEQVANLLGRQLDVHQSPECYWSINQFDLYGDSVIYDANSSLARVWSEDPVLVELLKIGQKLQQLQLKRE